MTKRWHTLVVDGNNLLARATYAAKARQVRLSNHDGVPTAALHIFIQMLSKYVRQEKPDHMVVCWDGGKSTYRVGLFDGYKAARLDKPAEEDPERPVSQAKEFLTLAGIHHVERPGVEADDIVAAYWKGKHDAEEMVILSADKDFLQLLDGWTTQIRPGTGADERWTRARVREEMKCLPEQLRKTMALTGDTSDNIPGILGFGHKTAVRVLAKHDWDLEAAITKEVKLLGCREAVYRNLALVTLPSKAGVPPMTSPRFSPTEVTSVAWPDLQQFLVHYDLERVRDQVVSGTLWSSDPVLARTDARE